MEYKSLPKVPKFDIPDELKDYGEGACFMIVHEEPGDTNSPLKFIHVFTAASEE